MRTSDARSGDTSARARRLRRALPAFLLAAAILLTGCRTGYVTHVVDGDTVDVDDVRVRVLGYDTPERGQCGFNEAKARVEQLIAGRGVLVLGATDKVATDRYGRELAYIRHADFDLGRVLIAEGLAHARYDSRDGYDWHPLEDEYRALDAATPNLCG